MIACAYKATRHNLVSVIVHRSTTAGAVSPFSVANVLWGLGKLREILIDAGTLRAWKRRTSQRLNVSGDDNSTDADATKRLKAASVAFGALKGGFRDQAPGLQGQRPRPRLFGLNLSKRKSRERAGA